MNNLKDLEEKLGLNFADKKLLLTALTHRSCLNEARGKKIQSNERLEFLGDAILSFTVSEWLYRQYPRYPEGDLTNLRSSLVKTQSLAKIANRLGLGDYLQMSRGERESGGNKNPGLLANTLEAVIGAIYLDQGLAKTQKIIYRLFSPLTVSLKNPESLKDPKSLLQEKIQAKIPFSPVYRVLKELGPDHQKLFTVGVYVNNKILATGLGNSKQEAEERAARQALEKI